MGFFKKFKEAWLASMTFDRLDDDFYEELEEALILADIGAAIGPGHRELPRLLPGRIVYINRAHRWFLVEADLGNGVTVREGFKF